MQDRKIGFSYDRDTKRMYRFKEESDPPVMGTVYVTKGAFEQRPARIEVTLKVVE